jgi:hypothetical protein
MHHAGVVHFSITLAVVQPAGAKSGIRMSGPKRSNFRFRILLRASAFVASDPHHFGVEYSHQSIKAGLAIIE